MPERARFRAEFNWEVVRCEGGAPAPGPGKVPESVKGAEKSLFR